MNSNKIQFGGWNEPIVNFVTINNLKILSFGTLFFCGGGGKRGINKTTWYEELPFQMTHSGIKPDPQFSKVPQGSVLLPLPPELGYLLFVRGSSSWQRCRTGGGWAMITAAITAAITARNGPKRTALSLNSASPRLCQKVKIVLHNVPQMHGWAGALFKNNTIKAAQKVGFSLTSPQLHFVRDWVCARFQTRFILRFPKRS